MGGLRVAKRARSAFSRSMVALERGDLVALHVAALDLHYYELGLAAVVVEEVYEAVYAGVCMMTS